MPSVQYLREFINERLTAAAEQIFLEFEKTIVQYEEEIDRQRRLLDITWKPQIKLHRTDVPQQHVCKEELLTDQQLCNWESLNQKESELPHINEEQEQLYSNQERRQVILKEETDTFMVTADYEESDHSEPEQKSNQLLSHSSAVGESQYQEIRKKFDSGSAGNGNKSHNNAEYPPTSGSQCNSDKSKKSSNCDVCGKAFKYDYIMRRHYRVHTGERPFSCKMCGKTFISASSLLKHTKTHSGVKPFCCTTCGKRFSYNSDLLKHTRSHTGEKPYHCATCGKVFGYSSSLLTHMRMHTGVKPYNCKTCGKTFKRNCHLTEHIRTHTGEELRT
ncbi:uncharacterized protein LOC143413501 isoform X1 [Maylandia zebra]|nr:zinc finger protein 773-like isoform X1 [Astatotilapia calliptera]